MNLLKALRVKLYNSYDRLQDSFKDYFHTGMQTDAIYVSKDKTLTCKEEFSDSFIQKQRKYLYNIEQFSKSKYLFNKQRNRILWNKLQERNTWNFNNQIDKAFGSIIEKHRNDSIVHEYNSEINTDRKSVHNFTNIYLGTETQKILNR